MIEFSEILRELRIKENLSQEALGNIVHVSRSAIAKYENGLGLPSEEVIEALCKYFKVDKDYLFPREDVEHLIVDKNKKIKFLKVFIMTLIILIFLFLCYTIYYFVNEAIINKKDLEEKIAEVEKYQDITSYDITLKNMQFEDTVYARVNYNFSNNMFIVDKGAKVTVTCRINKKLFDNKYGRIDIKFLGDETERIAYVEQVNNVGTYPNDTEEFYDVIFYSFLVKEQSSSKECLQIEYIKFEYEKPYLDEKNLLNYEICEIISYFDLENDNNKIDYFMYNYAYKEMKIYFYNDYIASISFSDFLFVNSVINETNTTNYKYLYEKLNDHLLFLKEEYGLEFSSDFKFATDNEIDLDFPVNDSFSLIITSDLLTENIDLNIPKFENNEISMSLNQMIGIITFELNGSDLKTNNFNILCSNDNVIYVKHDNLKGFEALKVGTAEIIIEVDLGYYKVELSYTVIVLPECEVFCKGLGTFIYPFLYEINDYLSKEVKEEIINKYNDLFERFYENVTKKVVDLYRPNEYYIYPIFEGDFKFESFELKDWRTEEPIIGDIIEINCGDSFLVIGEISKEEQEKLGLKTNLAESYRMFFKTEDEFFDGANYGQAIYDIQTPGEYKIAVIFVVGNPQYYVVKEYTLIVK